MHPRFQDRVRNIRPLYYPHSISQHHLTLEDTLDGLLNTPVKLHVN